MAEKFSVRLRNPCFFSIYELGLVYLVFKDGGIVMMRSLWSAASGMKAQQTNMDIVAHNIANVNTYGGKRVRGEFQDLIYQTLREAGAASGADSQFPTGLQIGLGTRVSATNRIFVQGPLQSTENPTDIGIQGEGFFRITLPDGTTAYTRDGTFKLDSERRLVTTDGYPLDPPITIDQSAPNDSIVISNDGRVSCTPAGGEQQEVGQITLTRFVNPSGLTSIGRNFFIESEASGDPIDSNPGEEGAGTLTQGTLEMSSVQIVDEMVDMIKTQRAYESNSKAIITSDSMLEVANGLKR